MWKEKYGLLSEPAVPKLSLIFSLLCTQAAGTSALWATAHEAKGSLLNTTQTLTAAPKLEVFPSVSMSSASCSKILVSWAAHFCSKVFPAGIRSGHSSFQGNQVSASRPGQAPRVIILNSYGAQQKDWPLYYCHGSHDPGLCPLLALPGGTHSGAVHSISAFTHHRWHSSLCAEGGLPRTGPRSRVGNGQIASRQISCTHRTCNAMDPLSNLRATGDKAILF